MDLRIIELLLAYKAASLAQLGRMKRTIKKKKKKKN